MRKIENARERFGRAAIELFRMQGYAETTVLQIAAAAGLTERTFFRNFQDKAEVLFWRAAELEAEVIQAVGQVSGATPLDRVVAALKEAWRFFEDNRNDVLAREQVVAAHAALQERERTKIWALTKALAEALDRQGVPLLQARLVAESGVTIWRVSIERWCSDPPTRSFSHHIHECRKALKDIVAPCGMIPSAGD